VKNLVQFNLAFLGKWLWRYTMERVRLCGDRWWTLNTISLRGGWCSKEAGGPMVWECGNVSGGGGKVFLNM